MIVLYLIHTAANDGVYLPRSGEHLTVVDLGTRVMAWAPRLRLVKNKLLEISFLASSGLINGLDSAADQDVDLLEAFQERSAIMQFDGGLPQNLAERMAAYSVYATYSAIPTRLHATGPNAENDRPMRKECP